MCSIQIHIKKKQKKRDVCKELGSFDLLKRPVLHPVARVIKGKLLSPELRAQGLLALQRLK